MGDLKDKGIDAYNQDFSQFEQVNKPQRYHLAEKLEDDEFDDEFQIQSCDMSAYFHGGEEGKQAFARQLGSALQDIGFAILTGHGIAAELYRNITDLTHMFFTNTSEEQRLPYQAKRCGSVNQGYFPIKETTIIHPDLVQGWVFCRRAFDIEHRGSDQPYTERDFWPHPGYEKKFRELVLAQEALIQPVMSSLLRYLACEPHLYKDKLVHTNFGFRLNYYPPVSGEERDTGAGRMLGHEDVDLFTFLPAPDVDGLQVLNRRNMKWIRLNAPPGSIILNTGDYMQRISNDIFPSTTHRVAHPSDPGLLKLARVSYPMAIYLWEEELLEVLPGTGPAKYPPVTALKFHTAITSKYYGADYAVTDD